MSRFTYVELYPATGFPERLMSWPDSTPVKDAMLRASRPVTELYSRALSGLDVDGFRSMLRLTPRIDADQDPTTVTVSLWPGRPHDLPGEFGFISFAPSVGRLGPRDRARLVLEAVHAAVLGLAEIRGWDPTLFRACYDQVQDSGFEYRSSGAWKSSPDRRHEARATFRLSAEDGWGRVRLQIRPRGSDEEADLSSEEAIAFCTSQGFDRSAKSLRWWGSKEVGLTPYCGLSSPGSGSVRGLLRTDGWHFEQRDDVTVRQPGGEGVAATDTPQDLPRIVWETPDDAVRQ